MTLMFSAVADLTQRSPRVSLLTNAVVVFFSLARLFVSPLHRILGKGCVIYQRKRLIVWNSNQ